MSERRGGRQGGPDRHGSSDRQGRSPRQGRNPQQRGSGGGPRARDAVRQSARDVALSVLTEVDEADAYANLLLPARLRDAGLDARDASLATELTYGTLRGLGLYDAVAEAAADRHPADLDPRTASAVRMGVHQLLNMRVADHAAVSETVEALRRAGGGRSSGLVNAVLRRVSAHDADTWIEELTAGRGADEALALRTSHPAWIVRALRMALRGHGRGGDGLEAALRDVLDADNAPAKVSLAALPGLADRDDLAAAEDAQLTPADLSPIGLVLETGDPRDVPGVADAHVRVQDQGSQLVALALTAADTAANPSWLDLCAGPGGKTAVLGAVAAGRNGRVHAVDSSEHRTRLVRESTAGSPGTVEAVHADGRTVGRDQAGMFSGVLVDVPCTGLGALRRRPEARWRRRPDDVAALAPLQTELLHSAIAAARPGGIIAYSTCSPHWAETAGIVDDVLPGGEVELLDAPAVLAELTGRPAEAFASAARGDGRFAQLWPDVHGTDAMFLALLVRR
ncbi:MAG: RsmB/NOP family class I SAM-dependent RNA methyltransferase [Brevibacterium yomogidense]